MTVCRRALRPVQSRQSHVSFAEGYRKVRPVPLPLCIRGDAKWSRWADFSGRSTLRLGPDIPTFEG